MLILARRPGETVTLETPEGRRITVMVSSVAGDKVKLGFVADAEVTIDRAEVRKAKDLAAGVAHAVAVAGEQR